MSLRNIKIQLQRVFRKLQELIHDLFVIIESIRWQQTADARSRRILILSSRREFHQQFIMLLVDDDLRPLRFVCRQILVYRRHERLEINLRHHTSQNRKRFVQQRHKLVVYRHTTDRVFRRRTIINRSLVREVRIDETVLLFTIHDQILLLPRKQRRQQKLDRFNLLFVNVLFSHFSLLSQPLKHRHQDRSSL